jgi:aldose 1-epimerase
MNARTLVGMMVLGVFFGAAYVHAANGVSVTREAFGTDKDGNAASLFTLLNPNGLTMKVSDYGCTVTSLSVPDKEGNMADVVLGYDSLDDYIKGSPYFGCVVGRYGNRIAKGAFSLDGKTYSLVTNNEPAGIPCHLHGGAIGFDKVIWDADAIVRGENVGVVFRHISPDGDEGYPGALDMTVTYWLTAADTFRIEYSATTDAATPVNLTHHSYFNLGGHDSGTILDHTLTVASDHLTAVDAGLIPTGELMPVKGTPFDFKKATRIGDRIDADNEQIAFGAGYDHNFVLTGWDGKLRLAARVHEPKSGRVMEVLTTEPGLQLYCGNFLDGSNVGKGGHPYERRNAFCLETQHHPDSPNQPSFPSTILRPGEVYSHTTEYRFSVK